jgi:hypothetical protein
MDGEKVESSVDRMVDLMVGQMVDCLAEMTDGRKAELMVE